MSGSDRPEPSLAVETEVSELVAAGHSRIDATMQVIERLTTEAREATKVVLVEGLSDQMAVEIVAERDGRALRADGTFVVPTGGAMNFTRLLRVFGPYGRDVRLLGLYDAPVEERIRRSLASAGIGRDDPQAPLGSLGFYACVDDLEEEMIRALGPRRVEEIVAAEGELRSLRRLQAMPFHRQRSLDDQLHRFIGSRSGRKYQYARAMALALDLPDLPAPLADLLAEL